MAPSPIIDISAVAPAMPFDLRATFTPRLRDSDLYLSWMHPGGASGYVVEVGFEPGRSDEVIVVERPTIPAFRWANPPPRPIFVRVKATNMAGVGPLSPEIKVVLFDLRDYIEAIYLGSGPLVPPDWQAACPSADRRWSGFRAGSTVVIKFGSSVPDDDVYWLENATEGLHELTNGHITISFAKTADPFPVPLRNEITVAKHPHPSELGCSSDLGCVMPTFAEPGVLTSARAILGPSGSSAREVIGHGALGMCRLERDLIGGPLSIMTNAGPTDPTAYDVQAIRAVYGSGLSPGATRTDFARVGLVRP